jgi:hypothetical protein
MKLTGPQATIIAAIVAVIGIAIGAFLNPWAEKVINQPTATPSSASLAIEQIKLNVFDYDGSAENLGGWANYDTIFDGVDSKPHYVLDYQIDEGEDGYAGLAFQFEKGKNLSAYHAIVFALQFDDVNVPIDLYVKDISGKRGSVRIVSNSTKDMPLRYEFSNFGDIDFNALQEVGINIDDNFGNGRHTVTIHSIRFEQ